MPLFRLFLAALALLVAGPAARPAAAARPALWVVRDSDTTIYLFGSVHELRPDLAWFQGPVRRAFAASDTLVLELVAPPDAEVQAALRRAAPPADAPPLPQRLPPGYAAKLAAAIRAAGYPEGAFDHMDPWLAATSLSVLPLRRTGYRREAGVEAVLTAAAARAGKPVLGLETQGDQIAMFDRLPEPVQIAMLTRVLDGQDSATDVMRRTADAWSRGDTDALAAIVAEDLRQTPDAVQQRVLTDRNAAWADWIARRMAQPGRVFVAVGVGHLVGPGSLQTALATRGLRVRRLGPAAASGEPHR
ncbi:TraB/GumN family protein [Sphingomonas sp. ac-8]|uniref:TraB/GumN family protein n=1 Tax=Sphingomonas sp. ac-8 TaxID=3242977 RepID=UPI003A7F7AF1